MDLHFFTPRLPILCSLALAACSSSTDSPPVSAPFPSQSPPTAPSHLTTPPAPAPTTAPEPSWEDTYASLLGKYVTADWIRYAGWKANPDDLAKLASVVDSIASADPPPSGQERLAFLLNAYNAWILHLVLADYPIKGIGGGNALGRNAFFGGDKIALGGKKTSFNHLENEIIRKEFQEPRIHFALNCASAGCPPLLNRPFRAASLDADLTRLTRNFLDGNPHGLKADADGSYSLSEIFDWFHEDFGDIPAFINRYREIPIPTDAKIGHHAYDWSLNDASS